MTSALVLRYLTYGREMKEQKERGHIMTFDLMMKQKIRQQVERVLHVPGNFTKDILEMAIVIDCSLSIDEARENIRELLGTLKRQSEVFRNVRLNAVKWLDDGHIENEVASVPAMQLGRYFEGYEQNICVKSMDKLTGYLKKFQARSKLIIVVSDGQYRIDDEKAVQDNLSPFLRKKMIYWNMKDGTFATIQQLHAFTACTVRG